MGILSYIFSKLFIKKNVPNRNFYIFEKNKLEIILCNKVNYVKKLIIKNFFLIKSYIFKYNCFNNYFLY